MKALMIICSVVFMGTMASATPRQIIKCTEVTRSKNKVTLRAEFNPEIELKTIWRQNEKGSYIVLYKSGKVDVPEMTTAKISFDLRPHWKAKSSLSAIMRLNEFYEVNVSNKTDKGNSRSFHGHPADHAVDAMFDFSEAALNTNARGFKGSLSYQPHFLDQGYYDVPLKCDSRLTK